MQGIASKVEGLQSVSYLAGYEVLTEGCCSNADTCVINLKDGSERKQSMHQTIEELEEKTKDFGAVIEFFEPTTVPGYGAASVRLLRRWLIQDPV